MSNDTQVQALPDWEHPLVQAAYKILCSDDKPPEGEHWEGFVARRFVAAVEASARQLSEQGGPERDDFMQGICVALQHVKADNSVMWREIVESVGVDDALNYAAFVEPAEWELAGFDQFAKQELGRTKPRKRRARPLTASPTAPSTEASESVAFEEIEAMATNRYKVVPSHESMFHRFAVVAGDGTRQIYLGREFECQNMAAKFTGAFLDGAFAALKQADRTTPPPAPALSDAEIDELAVIHLGNPGIDPTNFARAIEQAIGRASRGAK